MSGALQFFGGLVNGLEGYKAGVVENEKKADRDYERTVKRDKDAYDTEVRNADRTLLPKKTELAQTTTQNQIDTGKAEAALLPKKAEVAAGELEQKLWGISKEVFSRAIDVGAGQTKALTLMGEQIANGNMAGLTSALEHLSNSPLFPPLQSLGKPVKSELVDVQNETDILGGPISGRAIKVTTEDGSVKYLTPNHALSAYQKSRTEADNATAKAIKPGDKYVTQSGRVIAEGNDKAYGGLVQDEDGNWVDMRPRAGGTGTGKGKAPKSAPDLAAEIFETSATKGETKLTPGQLAYGQRLSAQLAANPAIPPAVAAEVAIEVATDPTKVQPKVNVQTGKVEGVFSRKDLGDVVIDPWSSAYQSSLTPEQVKKAAEEFVKAQPPEVRTQLVEAAHDPAARTKLEENLKAEIAKNYPGEQGAAVVKTTMATLSEKLEMISKNTAAPKKAGDKPGSIRERLSSIGGLSRAPATPSDPTSPAGRAQARQAELAAAREAKDASAAQAKQELSAQFQKDKAELDPLALAQKYDAQRGALPTADAAELQRIERSIR